MPSNLLVAPLPIGFDGLDGSKNMSQIPPTALIKAENISFDAGTLQKEGGAVKYNSAVISGAHRVIAGHDWFPSEGTQRLIVMTSNGDVLRDTGDGTFSTNLKSGLTISTVAPPLFVDGGKEAAAGNRKLFLFTRENVVQVLSGDGVTMGDLATPPADWSGSNQPSFGFIHEGRLWGGGNANDPHRLYYTDLVSHEDFTGGVSGTVTVYPGEGEAIIAAIPFKSLIIVFKKPRGIYIVDTTDPTVADWKVKRLNGALGLAGAQAVQVVDLGGDDMLFLDTAGNLQALSGVTELGLGSRNLSQIANMSNFIDTVVNRARLFDARSIYYAAKRELHFALSDTSSVANDFRLVIDFNREDRIRFRTSPRDTVSSMWLQKDSDDVLRPFIGDNEGFVWQLDQDDRAKDSVGYEGLFQSPHDDLSFLDPGFASRRKNFRFLEIVIEPTGAFTLNVDIIIDGTFSETVNFSLGSGLVALGTFILGTDTLGSESVTNSKRRITGSGRRISIRGRSSGASENFSVAKFLLHFTLGGERPSNE